MTPDSGSTSRKRSAPRKQAAAPAAATCHECTRRANGSCERCQRPTCDRHYFERDHLGLCTCCADELQAEIDRTGLYLSNWPYPVRAPLPGLGAPDDPT